MLTRRRPETLRVISNALLLELLFLAASALGRAGGKPTAGVWSDRATVFSVAGDIIGSVFFLNLFVMPTALLYMWLVPVLLSKEGPSRKYRLRALLLTPVGFPLAYLAAAAGASHPVTAVAALALPVAFALLMRLPGHLTSRRLVAGEALAVVGALVTSCVLATWPAS